MIVKLYTDGSCQGNPGPAGFGFLILRSDGPNEPVYEKFGSTLDEKGNLVKCTNQQSEMTACLEGLKYIKDRKFDDPGFRVKTIQVYSDSAYLLNCLKDKWYLKWRRNGWLTSKNEPVINPWLWKRIISCIESFQLDGINIEYIKVKAHQKPGSARYDEWNDRADQLANMGTKLSVENMPTE